MVGKMPVVVRRRAPAPLRKRRTSSDLQIPPVLFPELWSNNVIDVHRVLNTIFNLYLLLQDCNEAAMRVALEMLTSKSCSRILSWNRETWYNDDEKREWFKAQVKDKLEEMVKLKKLRDGLQGKDVDAELAAAGDSDEVEKTSSPCERPLQQGQSSCSTKTEQDASDEQHLLAKVAALEKQLKEVQEVAAAAVARAEAAAQTGTAKMKTTCTSDIGTGDLDVTRSEEDAIRLIAELEAALAKSRAETEEARREIAIQQARAAAAEKENAHLKIAVEELQVKLKNFLKKTEESDDPKIRKLIRDSGFHGIVNTKSVWDRLYDEAMERIQRLNNLRSRYKAKKGFDPLDGVDFLDALSGSKLADDQKDGSQPSQPPHLERRLSPVEAKVMTLGETDCAPTGVATGGSAGPSLKREVRKEVTKRKVVRCLVGDGHYGEGQISSFSPPERRDPGAAAIDAPLQLAMRRYTSMPTLPSQPARGSRKPVVL